MTDHPRCCAPYRVRLESCRGRAPRVVRASPYSKFLLVFLTPPVIFFWRREGRPQTESTKGHGTAGASLSPARAPQRLGISCQLFPADRAALDAARELCWKSR